MTKILKHPLFHWSTFLLSIAIVLYAYFRPLPPEDLFEHSDKLGHIVAFLALGLTARLALPAVSGALRFPAVVCGYALQLRRRTGRWPSVVCSYAAPTFPQP